MKSLQEAVTLINVFQQESDSIGDFFFFGEETFILTGRGGTGGERDVGDGKKGSRSGEGKENKNRRKFEYEN